MILRNINFDNHDRELFKLNISQNIGWNTYYEQYKNALCFLSMCSCNISIRVMSFLFIFRHTVELFLKNKIKSVELTHSLVELYNKSEGLPFDFLLQLNLLKCDSDGADFRYATDKRGYHYFNGEVLNLFEPFNFFINLIGANINVENKPKGKFEIHTHPYKIGQLSTDYDTSMCFIYEGVMQKRISINDIYLPFLFIIRHSIELSLKYNLIEVIGYIKDNNIKSIMNEHSLSFLFNQLNEVINIALQNLDKEKNEAFLNFREETKKYHNDLRELQQIVHNIDYNSYCFRFPIDKNGNLYKINLDSRKLNELLRLRFKLDAYLSCATPVLQEYGYW